MDRLDSTQDAAGTEESPVRGNETIMPARPARRVLRVSELGLPAGLAIAYPAVFAAITFVLWFGFASTAEAMIHLGMITVFMAIYFCVPVALASLAGAERSEPKANGGDLSTFTGPLSRTHVYIQVLLVPTALLFGVAMITLVAVMVR
ncbi:MAG: hypothetical protein R3C97_07275 [Geminicoccaceae bacterium]